MYYKPIPFIALLLSFFIPGLGHIYATPYAPKSSIRKKGYYFASGWLLSCILMSAVIGFVTTPIIWIWGMVDAYKSTKFMNQEIR